VGDSEEARAHIVAAGELFTQFGARLYLDQVLENKTLLKA
jgi:hypothetical protein